jgi:hypothetical protein
MLKGVNLSILQKTINKTSKSPHAFAMCSIRTDLNMYILSNGFPHLFGVEDPVKMSLSFFGSDINWMKRPPNNFLPNQKNWRVDGEYLIWRDSSLSNHSTMSKNNSNAVLFKGSYLVVASFSLCLAQNMKVTFLQDLQRRIGVETRLKGYKYFEIERDFFLINLVSWLMGILNLVYCYI